MTEQEFNNFIQQVDLRSAYNDEPFTSAYQFSIGAGWYTITASLITDLIAMDWDRTIAQVKEKFGGGRFYIGSGSKEIFERIRQWEDETFNTCETCGTTENVTTRGPGWIITLCDSCRNIAKSK